MSIPITSTGEFSRFADHSTSHRLNEQRSSSVAGRMVTLIPKSIQVAGMIALLAALGCSDADVPTVLVKGTVTLRDGTPVETGTVEFNSTEGDWTARGMIHSDGTFYLSTFTDGDGAVPGTHDAVVVQLIATEDLPLDQHDHGPTLDPKYAHYDRSGLQFTVKPDSENHIRIHVDRVEHK